jgi:hypothetical protein
MLQWKVAHFHIKQPFNESYHKAHICQGTVRCLVWHFAEERSFPPKADIGLKLHIVRNVFALNVTITPGA